MKIKSGGKSLKALIESILLIAVLLLTFLGWDKAFAAERENLEKDKKIVELEKSYPEIYDVLDSVTCENFDALVQEDRDIYVYIGRPSCGDCQSFEPELIRLIQKYPECEQMIYLNTHSIRQNEKTWELFKQKYRVSYTPTIAKFRKGELIAKVEWTPEEGISIEDVESWILDQMV